jgi:hypothetical protein
MRNLVRGSLLLIVTGMISGCASGAGGSSAGPAAAQAEKAADTKAWVMQSGGTNVLKLTTSADCKGTAKDGALKINAPQFEVEVWLSGAKSVDEATGTVATQIVDEFKDFKADSTTDVTIAGSPAKRLVGPGHEADDGDPGAADLIVFKVGDHVFVACTHGEKLMPVGEQGLLTIVQTAQVP